MKGTVSVWIWILGGVIAGLLVLTIANSYLTQTTRTIAEQRSFEQHDELRTQINELCWSSSENKKQYTVNLNENVLGLYLTKDKYTEYNETQFIDFILNENVSSGNLLCMKIKNKRLICSPIDCSTRMTFLGAVPTESSLSALIDNIIGNPGSFKYKLNFSKFGKEVLISVAGGKEVLPLCNLDNNCTLEECKEDCKDCAGPDPICVGDGFCNPYIDEDCLTSIDCACNATEGYACCLDDSASDSSGCVDETRQNLSKGKKCFCDNECNITANLTCNYVVGDMNNKACCEPGYSWNGSECIVPFCAYPCTPGCILPDAFDWRNYKGQNWMSPIKDQDGCGGCWAFSAVGAVEGTYKIEQEDTTFNPNLAEQDLISCSTAGTCNGGWHYNALKYIKNTGIVDEGCFPYRASDIACSKCSDWNTRLWKLNSYSRVLRNVDAVKRAVVCQGPLSIAMHVRDCSPRGIRRGCCFGSFDAKDVFTCDSSACINHAVVIAGYNDPGGYWIVRNSWGVGYEDGGYFKSKFSDCGIESNVWYAEGVSGP